MAEITQVITKFLDGKHKTLNFTTPTIPILSIKARIQQLTGIPIADQLLLSNGKTLNDNQTLNRQNDKSHTFPTVHLLLRLRGGKGGFGSLLRGAATVAGQKKTSNFGACRDMSGQRLRHVETERKLQVWNEGKKDRELVKKAEEFLKKQAKIAKKSGKGRSDGGAEKYVEKYRKDSAKCMEEVEKSVRESLANGFKRKRKGVAEKADKLKSKKLKIWMVKRKVDDSESEIDSSEEDDGSDVDMVEETEKPVVINNENYSDSKNEADGNSGSITGGKMDGESSVGCSSESGSDEEKETIPDGSLKSVQGSDGSSSNDERDIPNKPVVEILEPSRDQNKDSDLTTVSENKPILSELDLSAKTAVVSVEETVCQVSSTTSVQVADVFNAENGNSDIKLIAVVDKVAANSDSSDSKKPLDFDDFNSASEMEILGLERLKTELQTRGLKCGGTLQERAARLFLLKTIPLEKLPKKLLAKK